jgi:rhodanese-related sulfurtransferase
VKNRSRRFVAVTLLMAVVLATQGCAMLRRRAAERPPWRKVSPPIAYEMIRDTPGILILDLRSAEAFHGDTGHIYRAYNFPADQLPFRLLELGSFREETLLVYCDTQKCGEDAMAVLVSSGFEDAILIDGGIEGWIAKGFGTVLPEELAGRRHAERESPPASPPAPPALQQETEPHVVVEPPS